MRNMTKDEFTDVMESGYNMISMAAFTSLFYVIIALISTYYTAKAPPPAEGTTAKVVNTAATMVNPMFTADGKTRQEKTRQDLIAERTNERSTRTEALDSTMAQHTL
jgi:hypothetical protein